MPTEGLALLKEKLATCHRLGRNTKLRQEEAEQIESTLNRCSDSHNECLKCSYQGECRKMHKSLTGYLLHPDTQDPATGYKDLIDDSGSWLRGHFVSPKYKFAPILRY